MHKVSSKSIGYSSRFDAYEIDMKFKKFEKNQWYRFKIRVTDKKLQCFIDEEMVVDLPLEDRNIALRPGPIELSVPIGFSSFQCISKIRKINLRSIKP